MYERPRPQWPPAEAKRRRCESMGARPKQWIVGKAHLPHRVGLWAEANDGETTKDAKSTKGLGQPFATAEPVPPKQSVAASRVASDAGRPFTAAAKTSASNH